MVLTLVSSVSAEEEASPPLMELNLRTPMTDGTVLSTDIYRPDKRGTFPVILVRTPYTKVSEKYLKMGKYWANHDYVFMVQDVRGRGDSEGQFTPFVFEASDGNDAINWAADQPWSSGKVGMMGNSYLGWTQLYAAITKNPHLAAIIPTVAPPDPDRNFPMDGGVLMPAAAAWLVSLDGHVNQNLEGLDVSGAYSLIPFSGFDHHLGRHIKTWQDWVNHPVRDSYWDGLAYQKRLLETDIPALFISGWYDDVLVGATENFINLTRRNGKHQPQQLMIGPWGHAVNTSRQLGAIDFGDSALVDLPAIQLRWFDHWLKGIANGVESKPPVRIFVMGLSQWVDEWEWPIARTEYVKYYLHSDGNANSRLGDGTLSVAVPTANEQYDQYNYDPLNPVPYEDNFDWRQVGGPDDYSEIELRQDILVYTGPVFENPVRVCGPLKIRLFAASSAADTDWTAKVIDLHPNGFAQRLNDGIVRARFRHGTDHEEFLTAGKIEEYEINAWSTCQQFQKGHQLRLEISSSAFGKYARNLNGTGNPATLLKPVIARQRVYHDLQHASWLMLPVVADQ